ncbi:pre-toxin TG domain-containing protein [Bacillus sp. KH172YL63]|uniref:pre-toxin TG domain-containing protein n=1 Tax=Bacillus sp. KH172YL63 TaxID=2709784 RepID=UPI0013E44F1F|nr:pre-toxin TG domain-containing protein [Bacillus sp. KH172YL63]BCB02172.1 hypothetical protein KH172YL63_03050 [Bacillus sp. KH172YL63]
MEGHKSTARYLFSKNAWNDVKSGLFSTWEYTKNIGSYLFSKQAVKDAYQYVTSGEILMEYMEDFGGFATGVNPETQQKVSGMERIIAAGSIFKPIKALDKMDKVGKAADKAKMLAKVEDKKKPGVVVACKGIGKYDYGWDTPRGGGEIGGRRYSEHSLERMAPHTIQVGVELEKRALEKGLKPGAKEF